MSINATNTILTLPQNSVVITDAIKLVQQSKEKLISKKSNNKESKELDCYEDGESEENKMKTLENKKQIKFLKHCKLL